jgi:hypothetical protein
MPQQFGLQELQTIQDSLTYLSGDDSYHQGHSRALYWFLDLFIQQKIEKEQQNNKRKRLIPKSTLLIGFSFIVSSVSLCLGLLGSQLIF